MTVRSLQFGIYALIIVVLCVSVGSLGKDNDSSEKQLNNRQQQLEQLNRMGG